MCGLFNRNIYLILFFHTSTLAASVVSQLLNLIFSYYVNGCFTCISNGNDRRFSGGYRSLLYALSFLGEIALHAFISKNLLDYVSPYWTWFLTGVIIVPYSLVCLKVIFGSNTNRKKRLYLK